MRHILALGCLVLTLGGCVNVPVWERDVQQLSTLGKGLPVAEVDKILGRSTVLSTKSVTVDGTPYLFRHYELAVPTGQVKNQTTCYQTNGCIASLTPLSRMEPFAVVFAGAQPKLLAWGKMRELSSSTDPELKPVLASLRASYTDFLLKR